MRPPRSDIALRRLVADLADCAPADVADIVDALPEDDRQTVVTLLQDFRGVRSVRLTGQPPLSGYSPWLIERLESAPNAHPGMTVFAQVALQDCVAQIKPAMGSGSELVPYKGPSLLSRISARLAFGRSL